jgi:hypothetical protein
MASAAEKASSHQSWTIDPERRVAGLEVVLLKHTYVLPWSQFLYAEGSADQLRAVFTTHDLLITGTGLSSLLSDLAAQHLTQIREPARADKFGPVSGPRISTLTVTAAEQNK